MLDSGHGSLAADASNKLARIGHGVPQRIHSDRVGLATFAAAKPCARSRQASPLAPEAANIGKM